MRLDDIDVIPRETLFQTPARGSCKVSPCGRRFAFAAPVDGIMNLWVCERGVDVPASFAAARPVTHADRYGIHEFHWSVDGQYLLYLQGEDGDANHHLHALSIAGGPARDLTPFARAHATFQQTSRRHPGHVLITINRRDERFADLYRVDLVSGELELVAENPGYSGFIADDDFRVRVALAPRADRGIAVMTRGAVGWTTWRVIEESDTANTWPQALHADGKTLYMFDSRGRDTAALLAYDIESASDTGRLIAAHDKANVDGLWLDVDTHAPLAWTANHARREIHPLDDRLRADIAYLDEQGIGDWCVTSRTGDAALWIVAGCSDSSPATYYCYDRAAKTLCKLYDAMPALAAAPLARMRHTVLKSRDGLDLVSYLTLPVHADVPGVPLASAAPMPLVLLVHDGPHARDAWGYDPRHQWLANRGYAVLSVNFRGSAGFGKRFAAAGDRQWGAKMDDDLVDAVNWAIGRGIADPQRICIMGAGYGGYATLWGMTAHPRLYACGVDVAGPSNLATLARSVPSHLEAAKARIVRTIGDVTTAIGRMVMWERSPVHRAARICRPLLIGQGALDLCAQQAESEQIVATLKDHRVPVTYVLFPDEGHGFQRPANRIRFDAITERFLARYLGGRCEPETPEEGEGNSVMLVEGVLD